ncbi:MAG: hypothetical protein JXK95_02600 [Bacteroidales bacterium]|nr:hypothetical protein [Bacteroidales bacterium]
MKKHFYKKYIFLLCAAFIADNAIFAQEDIIKDGYNVFYYPTGKKSSEGTMRNGKPDGYWKTYYPSGIIKSEGNRRNHLLDSVWTFYNERGDTLQKISYLFGKRNGYSITYNVNEKGDPINFGKIVSKELYVNDKKEGLSFYYYKNGLLKEKVEYKNNRRNGKATEYDMNGKIITIQQFSDGVLTDRQKINRSDKSELKQGFWQEYYDNGRVKKEMYYKDDVLNGQYKEYDENGNVNLVLNYREGIIIEEVEEDTFDIDVINRYDENGNLVFSGTYRMGTPIGIHRNFNSEGKVVNAIIFNDKGIKTGEGILTKEGMKEGEWKYYYENGFVRAEGKYNNNHETGQWKYFSNDGKLIQTGVYKSGKFDGRWTWYYDNGSLKREEEYYNGKEEGIYTEYDTIGNIIASGNYFDGEREGEWFYKVNDYIEKGKYVGGLRDGKWEAYYLNEKLRYEGNYIQGNPDGVHRFYYEDGKVKEEQYYNSGMREKNWKKYNENGELVITITYKDNKEIRINGERIRFEGEDIKIIK